MKIEINDINNRKKIVPKTIYRGINLNCNDFEVLDMTKDIYPPCKPVINKSGEKVVGDGNEYGVYMTDNIEVAKFYARINNNAPMNPVVNMGDNEILSYPAIQIIYKIDTSELNVKTPKITRHLGGLYNNGLIGDEWIADYVPINNSKIINLNVGDDYLHELKKINGNNIEDIRNNALKEIKFRKYRLETLANEVNKSSNIKFDNMNGSQKKEILRSIFGEDGINYKNIFKINSVQDIIILLKQYFYKGGIYNIDVSSYEFVMSLEKQLVNDVNKNDINNLFSILEQKLEIEQTRKEQFIERKIRDKQVPNTRAFDIKINRIQIIRDKIEKYLSESNINYNNRNFSDKENIDIIDKVVESYRIKYNYYDIPEEEQEKLDIEIERLVNCKKNNQIEDVEKIDRINNKIR